MVGSTWLNAVNSTWLKWFVQQCKLCILNFPRVAQSARLILGLSEFFTWQIKIENSLIQTVNINGLIIRHNVDLKLLNRTFRNLLMSHLLPGVSSLETDSTLTSQFDVVRSP